MEVVEKENVKVPNCIIISGLTNTVVDEEVYDFLKKYGSITRVIKVSEETSEFASRVIVEFTSGEAVK